MRPAVHMAAALLEERIGLRTGGASMGRLERALCDEAADAGRGVGDYVAALAADETALQRLIDRVTVQETSFFRHPEQFAALEGSLLGQLPDPVLIWSAACSNGQEAYSLAMLLEEAGRPGHVIASDVSSSALGRTRAGRYAPRELRGLSEERRERFLRHDGDGFAVADTIRDRVMVLRHNLVHDVPPFPPGACHLVLCRNVLIYFSLPEVHRVLGRIHGHLPDGGHLMLGASEALWHVTDEFDLQRESGAFLYRRGADSQPVGPAEQVGDSRPLPDADEIRARAEAASKGRDWAAAETAYRELLELAADDVLARIGLAVALDSQGQADAARRAYRAARDALAGTDHDRLARELDGYRARDVDLLLAVKLGEAA